MKNSEKDRSPKNAVLECWGPLNVLVLNFCRLDCATVNRGGAVRCFTDSHSEQFTQNQGMKEQRARMTGKKH